MNFPEVQVPSKFEKDKELILSKQKMPDTHLIFSVRYMDLDKAIRLASSKKNKNYWLKTILNIL